MAADNPTTSSPSGGIAIGTRAEIFPTQPLPEFNAMGGPAFSAAYRGGEGGTDLMAILCNTGMPARLDFLTAMRSVDHPSLLRLIESSPILWPQDNTYHYALAFTRPLSPRLKHSIDEPHQPMSEDAINHYFVEPLIRGLMELNRVGVVHNAIRPTNIFWRIGSASPPQLGDCISAPAGFGQPALFEPIERAMSTPMGRGEGQHVDDCYSFGVTLALMFLGHNPMQGQTDEQIINAKIDRGTFMTLIGNHRLPATHIELLRGLLTDDNRQRWAAADLEQWLNGRRLTPKSSDSGRRAQRSFTFCGKEYWNTRPLASALATNVAETVQVVENGSLDKWLRRALGDDERATSLEEAQQTLKESGKTAHYEDQMTARTCIALDPPAPIRYRGMSVMPMGIADMLVDTVVHGHNSQILAEIIGSQFVTFWIEMQKEVKTEFVPLGQQFERMKGLIEKNTFGNGLERVMYELKPTLQCLSPMLKSQFVTSPKLMLLALERIATSGNRGREPMDRHIAAFLIVRDRRSELLFDAMGAPDGSARKGIAILTLFSEMQYRHGPDSLPGLAQWLLPLVEISLQRYLSKSIKDKLREQLREAAQRGNLSAMLSLVDDPKRIERDQQEFMAARMLYLNIMKEIAHLEGQLANREGVMRNVGKPMAASISTFLSILLILTVIIRAVWQAMNP